ncbi:hypothetical protein GOP47_0029475 [Adiantum capillus-veneris]|nr:hypothetical protein GOP47_0029475 [Adiantum capillus-veneris]
MALPVSTDAGYSQLLADYLSDSSKRNEGFSYGLYTFNALDAITASQRVATGMTLNSGSFLSHNGESPFLQDSGYVAYNHGASNGDGNNGKNLDNRVDSHNHDSCINAGQEQM